MPALFNPATTGWTVEALFRTDGIGGSQVVLQQRDASGTGRTLMQISGAGLITCFTGGASRPSDFVVTPEEVVHAAFVFERTGDNGAGEGLGMWTWYVNGEVSASGNFTGNDGVEPSEGGFLVGLHKSLTSQYFDGVIDEVAFYTHPLPASRIAAHHAAITRPPLIRLFSASPRGIQPGDSTTLTWSVAEDVTALTIAPAIGDVLPWTTGGGGSVQASPEASTTYRLTASRGGEEQVVAASVVVGAGGPFRINEFLAINAGPVVDEDGEESDWIEIKNLGATPGNLGGWYLTDDPDNRARWRFPETILQPGRFVLVFASGKDRADPDASLHTNFKLKGSGEYLALVEPDGVTIHHQFAPRFP